VFATDRPYGDVFNLKLQILDVAADTAHALNQPGSGPRWSPDGQWIAFGNAASIYVTHPDGTALRAASPAGHRYEPWTSWSPDGHWLMAEHEGPFIEVLEVATGLRLPLAFTGYLTTPAWRPF
jgi:Tol biopolymer transport system component